MKAFKIFLFCIAVSLFTVTCKKEHLPTQSANGSPVFYFNGLVGNNAVNLQAGKNNYYMYSSYTQDNNNVYNYIANLKEFNCNSGCVSSIQFIINDNRDLPAGASENNISSSLATGNYGYSATGNSVTKYKISYIPSVDPGSAPVKSFTFNYGDGTDTSGSKLPTQFTHTYSAFARYKTSLSVVFSDGNSSIVPLTSSFTPKDSGSYALSSIITVKLNVTQGSVTYTDKVDSNFNGYIIWNFGDGYADTILYNPSTSDTISHFYGSSGIYNLTTIINNSATHDSIFSVMQLRPYSSTPLMDIANYSASPPKIAANPYDFSNVTINYTDPTGNIYTTADSVQRAGSNFQIISVAPYNNNENNQATKQLHLKFNCTLHDNTGKAITINGGDAIIAVAYK